MGYKRALLSAIIICLALFPIPRQGWAVQQSFEGFIALEQVLDFVGCDREYLNVNGWCLLNKDYMSLDDLKSLATKAAYFFELEGYEFISTQGNGIKQVSIRGTNKYGQIISIACKSIQTLDGNNAGYESYIVVDIADDVRRANSAAVKDLLKGFFETVGVNSTITMTLSGSFKGELEPGEMRGICSEILKYLGAVEVEGLYQEGLVSVSGYAPVLGKGIVSGSRQVNVQVALRYSPYKGRTYVWIGTPIISIEY